VPEINDKKRPTVLVVSGNGCTNPVRPKLKRVLVSEAYAKVQCAVNDKRVALDSLSYEINKETGEERNDRRDADGMKTCGRHAGILKKRFNNLPRLLRRSLHGAWSDDVPELLLSVEQRGNNGGVADIQRQKHQE